MQSECFAAFQALQKQRLGERILKHVCRPGWCYSLARHPGRGSRPLRGDVFAGNATHAMGTRVDGEIRATCGGMCVCVCGNAQTRRQRGVGCGHTAVASLDDPRMYAKNGRSVLLGVLLACRAIACRWPSAWSQEGLGTRDRTSSKTVEVQGVGVPMGGLWADRGTRLRNSGSLLAGSSCVTRFATQREGKLRARARLGFVPRRVCSC